MKPRHSKPEQKPRKSSDDRKTVNPVDQLGIERGLNGEKGNTVNPRNIQARDVKEASH